MHQARWQARGRRPPATRREHFPVSEEANFRATFDHTPTGFAFVDVEGHPVGVTPALEQILGHSAEDVIEMVEIITRRKRPQAGL